MAKYLVISTLLLASLSASAVDLGFRYDASSFLCLNENKQYGFNPDFSGECGSHIDGYLVGTHWEGFELSGSNFTRANLKEASFYDAVLRGAQFDSAELRSVNFEFARLIRADLRDVSAQKTVFYWANLQNANMQGGDFSYADFRGATMDLALVDTNTKFGGAVFDEFTSLPFSHRKARSLGMKFIPSRVED